MLVNVNTQTIVFPSRGWLSTRTAGPHNGRVLLEVKGHTGMDSWLEILLTVPEDAVETVTEKGPPPGQYHMLCPGVYEIQEGQDRRGRRVIRLYRAEAQQADAVLFAAPGHLVSEASSSEAIEVVRAEGWSRTGRHGNRWALIAAPAGAVVAVEPYGRGGDPIYYRVTPEGPVELGATDAVLSPDEW